MGDALLREVSRSFSITLALLPRPIRGTLSLGYLLARASDSIADTNSIAVAGRLSALDALAVGRIDGALIPPLAAGQTSPPERRLVEALPVLLGELRDSPDRDGLQGLWREILRGQRLDLARFPCDRDSAMTAQELDDYTFAVAGSVGEYWTRLCLLRLAPYSGRDPGELARLGISLGKALQLVNILRDAPSDRIGGRWYFHPDRFRELLDRAYAGLADGARYADSLRSPRLRLAIALPVLLGARTLDLVAAAPERAGNKVGRGQLRLLVLRCVFAVYRRNGVSRLLR